MSNYVLITPEIEVSEATVRNIGKTFIASAVVERLRADRKTVLHIDESRDDGDFITSKINDEIMKGAIIRKRVYDYIVIAGKTQDVENAFRILRRQYYPQNIKTIKLQSLS